MSTTFAWVQHSRDDMARFFLEVRDWVFLEGRNLFCSLASSLGVDGGQEFNLPPELFGNFLNQMYLFTSFFFTNFLSRFFCCMSMTD
jgi:hypothetical protein